MYKVFQFLYLSVFVICTLFIFISSYWILNLEIPKQQIAINFPTTPNSLKLEAIDPKLDLQAQEEQLKLYKTKVDVYTQQVTAFTQEVTAYKTLLENQKNITSDAQVYNQKIELYKLVIKDSLIPILIGLITAIAAYIFVKTGLEIVANYYRNKTAANS